MHLSFRFLTAAVFALVAVLLLVLYFLTTTKDSALLLQQLAICTTLGELTVIGCALKALASLDDRVATRGSDAGAFAHP
ncbi:MULTISPECIES: hypothetical protein [Cupriavidus]|uniref:hypothetical protein n=1 Tax=Cupriavidus sp. SK-3 TaxID=1470558 RepID=UPI000445D937|nr:hypothetical protein [Cupriavidus sp. SK-3]KDP84336.1 hypothetical protein CF70_019945 [Cupriavidus sp. SK-3]